MTLPETASRDEVLAILTEIGYRSADMAHERIDSLELARLVYELEQRYGVELTLDDADLQVMGTVTGAAGIVERIRRAQAGS